MTAAAGRGLAALALAVAATAGGGCQGAGEPAAAPSCRRLVAMAPNLAELAFAVGLGDRVVGVSDHTRWPAAAAGLPRLGGLLDPHVEEIVALEPDLVVLLPSQEDLAGRLGSFGIGSLVLRCEDLGDVAAAARRLGERCGAAGGGEALARRLERELSPRPVPGRPRVLVTVGRPAGELAQIFAAGPGTFLDELLARLGAVNVLADAAVRWPQVALEELVARDPDVIVELQGEELSAARRRTLVADWQALPALGAVRRGAVVVVDGDEVLLPGPRLPRLYESLRRALLAAGGAPA